MSGTKLIRIHHADLSRSCQRLAWTAKPGQSRTIAMMSVNRCIAWLCEPKNMAAKTPMMTQARTHIQKGNREMRPSNENSNGRSCMAKSLTVRIRHDRPRAIEREAHCLTALAVKIREAGLVQRVADHRA